MQRAHGRCPSTHLTLTRLHFLHARNLELRTDADGSASGLDVGSGCAERVSSTPCSAGPSAPRASAKIESAVVEPAVVELTLPSSLSRGLEAELLASSAALTDALSPCAAANTREALVLQAVEWSSIDTVGAAAAGPDDEQPCGTPAPYASSEVWRAGVLSRVWRCLLV